MIILMPMEQEMNQAESSSEDVQDEKESGTKRKSDIAFELVLIFILGFLLGVTVKTEAAKRVTIGFNDYKIQQVTQGYDFAAMREEQQKAQEQQTTSPENAAEDPSQQVQQ